MSIRRIFMLIGIAIAITIAVILLMWLIRWWAQGGQFKKKNVRIVGKVVIITGCNTGIGKQTAIDLARRGGKIYMACRDRKRCEDARQEIIQKTGNNNVFNKTCDLASFESVRLFVKDFLREESRLDILINNGGIMFMPRTETKDGFEMHLGVNHLGHFLLTNLLLVTLKASMPSRIINVSSAAHQFGKIDRNDLNSEKSYNEFQAYFQSKLANVLFTRALAKRLLATGVTANSLHPGVVNTELQRNTVVIVRILLWPLLLFFKTPKSGAQTTIALAVDPELEQVSGRYFSDCHIVDEAERARDDDTAEWLWKTSDTLTGLDAVVNDV